MADSILTSDYFFPTYDNSWYRPNQEVQIDPDNGALKVGAGLFSNSIAGLLTYTFDLSSLGISPDDGYDLGFRWSETCTNDIIEGGGITKAAVPEPATLVLLGIGLLGVGAVGRKKKKS